MSNVIHRTTKQYLKSVNTALFSADNYIINPDMSDVSGVATKHLKITGDVVSEMNQTEKNSVSLAELAISVANKETDLKKRIFPSTDLKIELGISCGETGLVIDCTSTGLGLAGEITVTADGSETKCVKVLLVYNSDSDTFYFEGFEKTTGEYDDLTSDEYLLVAVNEWSVVASGTEMVVV